MEEDIKEKRVHQVARSLKDLHIVSSMEDALERARQIIGSTSQEEKSIKDLMDEEVRKSAKSAENRHEEVKNYNKQARKELDKEVSSVGAGVESSISSAKESSENLESVKKELKEDKHVHGLVKGDIKATEKELDVIECAVDDVDEIVEEAEKVQKEE